MDWTLTNRGTGDIQFHIALATKVVVGDQRPGDAPVRLTRGKSSLTISGIDTITQGEDGKVLNVVVKGGATRRLTLAAGS